MCVHGEIDIAIKAQVKLNSWSLCSPSLSLALVYILMHILHYGKY